jgi:hypothetical protein
MPTDPPKETLEEIAARTSILDPEKQRALWAKVIALKTVILKSGLATKEEMDRLESAARKDLDDSVLRRVARDLGAEEG